MKTTIEIEITLFKCERCGHEDTPTIHHVSRKYGIHTEPLIVDGCGPPEGWGEIQCTGACGTSRVRLCPKCAGWVAVELGKAVFNGAAVPARADDWICEVHDRPRSDQREWFCPPEAFHPPKKL
jgi:hypothetical protein